MDDYLFFDLPSVKFEQLPTGMVFSVTKIELAPNCWDVLAHTPDFKCILPEYLSKVFRQTEDFWFTRKSATMVNEGGGLLTICDSSSDPRPILECLAVPKWTYYDVIAFDLYSITTPYFRVNFVNSIEHFDSLLKLDFWKTRIGLKVCFEEHNLHFTYNSGNPPPFLEPNDLPLDQYVCYEIEKFERGPNNSTIIHTKYFSCKIPETQNEMYDTKSKLDFWNKYSDLYLSFSCCENDDTDLTSESELRFHVNAKYSMNSGKFWMKYVCETGDYDV